MITVLLHLADVSFDDFIATITILDSDYPPAKPLTPYVRFYVEHRKTVEGIGGSGVVSDTLASVQVWKELPEVEKQVNLLRFNAIERTLALIHMIRNTEMTITKHGLNITLLK